MAVAGVIAARSPALCRFFTGVMRRRVRGAFHALRLAGAVPEPDKGARVIVYTNHPSWWDPAVFMVLGAALFPGRDSYGPMEAEALRRYAFMRRIGIFGVEPGHRGAGEFLRVGAGLTADPRRMLWVTAEGAFTDPRVRPVRLRPGAAHLMARDEGLVALPLALEYPYWQESRPEALCRFGAPLSGAGTVTEWRARLETGLGETMEALARDAMAQDPARFRLLLGGKAGVGGVYDAFRRTRAGLRGERFRPEHRPEDAEC